MTTEFRVGLFVLVITALAGCRHAPELAKAESYPVCCTEAIPAANRINLEQLKDVPVPEIVQFGGLKYVNDAGKEVELRPARGMTRGIFKSACRCSRAIRAERW